MKKPSRSAVSEPTMMIHHVKEFQIRLLVVVAILIVGMVVGYFFYEPLFAFIKAPLNGPLHYTSPSGSFTFVIKICLLVGIITAIPAAVYNIIMFVQPALKKRLSKVRVYLATLFSLLLATIGGSFAFFIIIPLALKFFYKFQVDGLVALISADDYLRFVVGVIITFVLIFQLPLIISFIDHIKPLSPLKLFKAEKYIIVGSVAVGVLVPFAFDPVVQMLIASPIIVLYNLSIGIVFIQRLMRAKAAKRHEKQARKAITKQPVVAAGQDIAKTPVRLVPATEPLRVQAQPKQTNASQQVRRRPAMSSEFVRRPAIQPPSLTAQKQPLRTVVPARPVRAMRPARVMSDIAPRRAHRSPDGISRPVNLILRTSGDL
jgi:sec-independent protein translocase protein TatC